MNRLAVRRRARTSLTRSTAYGIVAGVPEGLRPLEGRARWAVIGLVAVIVSDVVATWSDWLEIDLMNRVLDGDDVSLDELESNDDRQAIVGILQLLALVASAFFFIRWFHAAYANLRALGQPNLRFGTGWAIGAWFVPFLNLWRPKQIANDIWRGSDPEAPSFHSSAWKDAGIPLLLGFWWGAWIVTNILGNAVGRAWFDTGTAENIRAAARLDLISSVIDIGAAVLAVVVVRRLTARQAARRQRLAASGSLPATMTST